MLMSVVVILLVCACALSSATVSKYVQIDPNLVARKIENINSLDELPGREKPPRSDPRDNANRLVLNKYPLLNETMKTVLQKFHQAKTESNITYEAVIGTEDNVWYDHDWGFFSAVLAAYNNHWVLRTSPDDWWNVIVRNVAQVIDEKGNRPSIRKFFVDHEGKKEISINVGPSLGGIEYSWLFDQFSAGIRQNIKNPQYVDLIQADFSTTTPQQLITTQIMLMSSLQKYFDYSARTSCGIPGVDMSGTMEDWFKLYQKLHQLESLLKPILGDLEMVGWFKKTKVILNNLLDTYRGEPDIEWWGHILSWNERYGSGAREWFSGWMTEFLMAERLPEKPRDFQGGLVSVPLKLVDMNVEDTGILVAGTVGFTVEEAETAPVVTAKQGWTLLMPNGSPITQRLLGK